MERDAADWYVGLFDYEAPELLNYDAFIAALHNQFEDPLVGTMAHEQLQHLRQGEKTVSGYPDEFRHLAARVPEWTEVNRVHAFRDGLRRDLLLQCLGQAHPATLMGWIRLTQTLE